MMLNLWVWRLSALAAASMMIPLVLHTSDEPVVFGLYSVGHTVLLVTMVINVALFWRYAFGGPASSVATAEDSWLRRRALVLLRGAVVIGVAFFLVDLLGPTGMLPPEAPRDIILVGLAVLLVVQIEANWPNTVSSPQMTALAVSLLSIALLTEVAFRTVLLQREVPRTRQEFLTLVRNLWPAPIALDKPAGMYRIVGIADSFGVRGAPDRNFHTRLEQELNDEPQQRVQMINVSVEAYEPGHELKILPFGLEYQPDLLLHSFFVGNDFSLDDEQMYSLGAIAVRPRQWQPYRPSQFLSRLWVQNAGTVAREQWAARNHPADDRGTFTPETFLRLQRARLGVWGRPDNRRTLERVFPVVDAIRARVADAGTRYVMVIHPDQTQIDLDLQGELLRSPAERAAYDLDLPQRVLRDYCESRGIACIDLLQPIREAATRGVVYELRDTHYNEQGNRVAAAAIAAYLRNHVPQLR